MATIYKATLGESNSLMEHAKATGRMIVWTYADAIPLIEAGTDEELYALFVGRLDSNLKPMQQAGIQRSRRYDLTLINSAQGDIWTTVVNGELWWARLADQPGIKWEPADTHFPERTRDHAVAHLYRETTGWSNYDLRGRRLNNLHPFARGVNLLLEQGTLSRINKGAEYALALIEGDDETIVRYHNLPEWKAAARGWRPSMMPDAIEAIRRAHQIKDEAQRIVASILGTIAGANGQMVERRVKEKITDMTKAELEAYVGELLTVNPDRRCSLTGMTMESYGARSPYAVSPDRIDSQRGYVRGNIQLVCQFVNKWKQATPDEDMRALLSRLRDHWERL